MTNPIAVSQRARRAAENLNYSGGDLSSNARAFARFEAEIRATHAGEAERLREALRHCAEAPHSGWTIAQAIARQALEASR